MSEDEPWRGPMRRKDHVRLKPRKVQACRQATKALLAKLSARAEVKSE